MKLLKFCAVLAMFFVATTDVEAGKSGSSSSSSSGGSRPSFGGGSSSRPSFGGGSSVSKPSTSTFSAPTVSRPTFGGGSSTPAAPSRPTFGGGSSTPVPSGGISSSRPSFGGGSTPKPTVTTNAPIPGKTPLSVSKKPAAESFDKLSATESKKIESRKAYEKSEAPAASYKTASGKEVKINPNDKETSYLRGRIDEAHWQTRATRTDTFYGGYYGRPMVVYTDHYNPYWNYWLMGQSLDIMTMWIYHHQLSMDQARLNAMYAQNADLRARVIALERQGIPRDPTYTPKGVDPDLMYDDGYVNAVYNPRPKTVEQYEYSSESSITWGGFGRFLLWTFIYIPLMCLGVYFLYYFIFVHRW